MQIARVAKVSGITVLLIAVFVIVYAAVHAALVLGISYINGAADFALSRSGDGGGPFTYGARITAAVLSPGIAIGAVKYIGRLLKDEGYRVPLMALLVAFAIGGWLLNRPAAVPVWQDTAIMGLETTMIIAVALSIMPVSMAVIILRPIVVPLVNLMIREKK